MQSKSPCLCSTFASKTHFDETGICCVSVPVGLYPWHSWDSNTTKDMIAHFDLAQDCMRMRGHFLRWVRPLCLSRQTLAKPFQFSYCHFREQISSSWHITTVVTRGHDSSVGLATYYGVDSSGFETSWGWNFPQTSIPAQRQTLPPYTMDTGALCRG